MLNNPTRITIVLALIVLGLGGYILFVDIPQTRQFQKQETQERQLIPFDDREITTITWATATETIQLERDEQFRWTITKPMRFPAENQEVRRILRALTIGKIKRTSRFPCSLPCLFVQRSDVLHIKSIAMENQ